METLAVRRFVAVVLMLLMTLPVSMAGPAEPELFPAVGESSPSGDGTTTIREGLYDPGTAWNNARNVARGPGGVLHAVYTVRDPIFSRIYYASSSDDGKTWTESPVSEPSGIHQSKPAVAVDRLGRVHVVWFGPGWAANPGFENIQYRMWDGAWGPQESVSDIANYELDPSVAVDEKGQVHVVWNGRGWGSFPGSYNIVYRERKASGWQANQTVTNIGSDQYSPTIAVLHEEKLHVAWLGRGFGATPGSADILHSSRSCCSWSSVYLVTDVSNEQGGPSIAVDRKGGAHIAWFGPGWGVNSSGTNVVYRSNIAGIWQSIEPVSDRVAPQYRPSVTTTGNGEVIVAWHGSGWGSNPGTYDIITAKRTSSWQSPQSLTDLPQDQYEARAVSSYEPRAGEVGFGAARTGVAVVYMELVPGNLRADLKLSTSSDHIWDDAPRAPTLVTPAASAVTDERRPSFSWRHDSPVGRAQTGYELQLDDDPAFASPEYSSGPVASPSGAHTAFADLPTGLRYWRVRTEDSLTLWGDWSTGRALTIRPPAPAAHLVSPNGGEDWIYGRTYPITWSCAGTFNSTPVQLHYSKNGGNAWDPITFATENDGVFNWTSLPNYDTPNAMVRVRCTDVHVRPAEDVSDTSFSIDPPPDAAVPLSSPTAGAIWGAGAHTISWGPSALSGPIDLDFTTDAGATWLPIARGTANSGAFPWDVPATNTRSAQLRISGTDAEGNALTSTGPFFVIDSSPPTISTPEVAIGTDGAATVSVKVNDNFAVAEVSIVMVGPDGVDSKRIPMRPIGGSYVAFVGEAASGSRYSVEATDGANVATSAILPIGDGRSAGVPAEAAAVLAFIAFLSGIGIALVSRRLKGRLRPGRPPSRDGRERPARRTEKGVA